MNSLNLSSIGRLLLSIAIVLVLASLLFRFSSAYRAPTSTFFGSNSDHRSLSSQLFTLALLLFAFSMAATTFHKIAKRERVAFFLALPVFAINLCIGPFALFMVVKAMYQSIDEWLFGILLTLSLIPGFVLNHSVLRQKVNDHTFAKGLQLVGVIGWIAGLYWLLRQVSIRL